MKRKNRIEKKTKPKLLAKLRDRFNYISEAAESLDAFDVCVAPEEDWCLSVHVSQVLNNCRRFLKRKPHRQSKSWMERLIVWLDECGRCIFGYGPEYPSTREMDKIKEEQDRILIDVLEMHENESKLILDLLKWKNIILGLE